MMINQSVLRPGGRTKYSLTDGYTASVGRPPEKGELIISCGGPFHWLTAHTVRRPLLISTYPSSKYLPYHISSHSFVPQVKHTQFLQPFLIYQSPHHLQ